MKIGLIDVDGHSKTYPNYALMKISAYHKDKGDTVEWAQGVWIDYDRVYKAKVFTFTPDLPDIYHCETIKGGTGYDPKIRLPQEIDDMLPDYSLYGIKGTSYGFLTRGCCNKCPWCIVPIKEGSITPYRDIEQIVENNKKVVLMDNNILASDYGLSQLEKIVKLGIKVDFNQGLDARLITDDVAQILAKIQWHPYIRLACDQHGQIPHVIKAHERLEKYGYTKEIFCYFLINDFDETIDRMRIMHEYKWFTPFGQPYRDFNNPNQVIPMWQRDFAFWMDRKSFYRRIPLEDFVNTNGHVFRDYFESKGKDNTRLTSAPNVKEDDQQTFLF